MEDMRQVVLPILENYGVDLVLSGHSHAYERSFLLKGHYGNSASLNPSMILDSGDGREGGNGVYQKAYIDTFSTEGTVYITTGSAGQTGGGPLNHPAMYTAANALGSCILEVDSSRLTVKFLSSNGSIADSFAIEKTIFDGYPPSISMVGPLDGTTFLDPQAVMLQASANDPDGTVVQVEFFVNDSSVGTGNVAPWGLALCHTRHGNLCRLCRGEG